MRHRSARQITITLGLLGTIGACESRAVDLATDAMASDVSLSTDTDLIDATSPDASTDKSCRVIGHRGAAGLFPENTVAGVRDALALGIAGVELDVRLSADGHAVLMHDATVDRTTDGSGTLSDLTLAELQKLDAGQGEPVPTLAQALAAIEPHHVLLCEFKGAGTELAAFEAVREAGLLENTFFTSFYPERLENLRNFAPEAKIGVLLNAIDEATLREVAALEPELLNLHFSIATEESMRHARAVSPRIRVFNPDNEAEQRRVCALGVDYLGTNRPDLALGWLNP